MIFYTNIEINEEPTDIIVWFTINSNGFADIDSIEDMRGNPIYIEPSLSLLEECEEHASYMRTEGKYID